MFYLEAQTIAEGALSKDCL